MLPRNSLPELRAVIDEDSATATETASPQSPLRLVGDAATTIRNEPDAIRLVEQLIAELRSHRRRSARVVVKTSGKVLFLRAEEIEWIEAAGNYVRLHARGETFLYRESMKNMEARLDNELFVRIHRSAIINVDRIRELQPWFHGEYVVILQDGTRLMASRVFSDRLDRLIA